MDFVWHIRVHGVIAKFDKIPSFNQVKVFFFTKKSPCFFSLNWNKINRQTNVKWYWTCTQSHISTNSKMLEWIVVIWKSVERILCVKSCAYEWIWWNLINSISMATTTKIPSKFKTTFVNMSFSFHKFFVAFV